MDNDEEERVIHVSSSERTVEQAETNDSGVYHFKVSKVNPHTEARRRSYATAKPSAKIQKDDTASSKEQMDSIDEASKEARQITNVSTMSGPDDNSERASSDQRGVYRFKVQVDEAQLRRAEWWQFWSTLR